jgi:hypothetical protein
MVAAATAMAADEVSVLKIDAMITEKGSDTYSLSIKAFVKNTGPADDITVNVVALDDKGFELYNTSLSGSLNEGQTKVLVAVIQMPKAVYDQVIKWEWKK